jgi:serine/threonine-protein kinase
MKICPICKATYAETVKFCPTDGIELVKPTASVEDPLIHTLFAKRFYIEAKLGEGGMGSVYKATQTHINRACAIKVISPRLLSPAHVSQIDSEQIIARFKREAALASRIDNPHIVRIYDFGETDDAQMYLVMEYVAGEPLTALLAREKPLALNRAVEIAQQMADALAAAHAIGIIHRDLKPDNVLLCTGNNSAGQVKLLDFGIAKSMEDAGSHSLTQTGGVIGTPLYMAPEQLLGSKLDARADVYSFALIVYEMLTGRLPVERNEDFIRSRIYENPLPLRQFNAHITPEVEAVVMAALERERETRTPTISAFASAFVAAGREPVHRLVVPLPPAPLPAPNPIAPATVDTELRPPASAAPGSRISKTRAGLFAAVGLILLMAIGYFLYTAYNRNPSTLTGKDPSTPVKTAEAAPPQNSRTSEGVSKEASAHYDKGKQSQETARGYANTGKINAAILANAIAIEEFNMAVSIQPIYPEAYENLALALCDSCNYADSLPKFKTAITQSEQSGLQPTPKLFTNYALTLYDLKMYEDAASMFDRASKLNPVDYDLLAFSGFAWQNAGRKQEANNKYQEYLDKNRLGNYAAEVLVLLKNPIGRPPTSSGHKCFKKGSIP